MKTDRPSTRDGFTMIELLVVILLMTIMMSILVSLVQGVTGTSRQAATKSAIIKISRMLENRTGAFHRFMDKLDQRAGKERPPRYVKGIPLFRNIFRNGRRDLARILARKHEYRRHFPQMFSEDNDSLSAQNWPQSNPNFNIGNHLPETESAECLYYFITQGETFGAEPIDADAFTSREVMDTDGDGLMEFVDSWGNPLRFYRWPTRLIRPDPDPSRILPNGQHIVDDSKSIDGLKREFAFRIDETAASVIFGPLPPRPQFPILNQGDPARTSRLPFPDDGKSYLDPTVGTEFEDPLSWDGDDPLGMTFRWRNTPNLLTQFENNWLSPENFEKRYHTASTYHVPLIISAGPDREPGLYEPHDSLYNVQDGSYTDTKFGRLAQPIISSANPLVVDERLYDDISNLFLRSGVTR